MRPDVGLKHIMSFLSSFGDYSWERKEAPKDPKLGLYENRLRSRRATAYGNRGISLMLNPFIRISILSFSPCPSTLAPSQWPFA
jgi:hypothetical protein